jgi:hypothetical protein
VVSPRKALNTRLEVNYAQSVSCIDMEADAVDNSIVLIRLSRSGERRGYIYMTSSSNTPDEENGDGAGMKLSQIVIEAEGLGDPGAMLCLRVDTNLIAENLTTAQMKFLICGILDRLEGEKQPKSMERQLH